jgi:hypothetical protein
MVSTTQVAYIWSITMYVKYTFEDSSSELDESFFSRGKRKPGSSLTQKTISLLHHEIFSYICEHINPKRHEKDTHT